MPEFTRPYLYPKQLEAIFCDERFGLTEASTKSGKTVGCIAWIVEESLGGSPGQNFWWVAPGYNQAEIAYRRIKMGLTKGSFTAFDTPTPRISTMAGTWIWFKSADNPDSLYGEDVYAVVVDEASRVSKDAWHAIRSTLTATRGRGRLIGNVKGRKNWFFELARRAELGDLPGYHYARLTADDAVEAGVLDAEEIEDARRTLPENVFRELYYAEPGDDTGNPFGLDHIRACISPGFAPGPVVAWGVDLAKKQDYFVIVGLNDQGGVAALHRWRGIPWRASIRRAWAIIGEDTPALVDSTGVGDPVLEELQFEHGNFMGFMFGPSSKQKLMEGLAVSIQSHEVSFPDGVLRQELEMFEYELTRTGVRYSAPEGHYDDCVCALALARQMWTETAPGANVMKFYAESSAKLRAREVLLPETNNRPWQTEPLAITYDDTVGKELEELYNEVVAKTLPSARRICARCKEPVVGSSRVTDSELFWHPACAGTMARSQVIVEAPAL